MNITIECIHRTNYLSDLSTEFSADFPYTSSIFSGNSITCHINNFALSNGQFYLPKGSLVLNDILNLSDRLQASQKYDCILEIDSFTKVELFTNHQYSVRGKYWNSVPESYRGDYGLFMNQQCIEFIDDILLISQYNNILRTKVNNGELIEIIPQYYLNLRAVTSFKRQRNFLC